MSWILIALAAWVALALSLGLALGASIRLADWRRREDAQPFPDFVPAAWTSMTGFR